MKRIVMLLCLLSCVLVFGSIQAKMYTWTDENGVKHFSNTQPRISLDKVEQTEEIESTPDPGTTNSSASATGCEGVRIVEWETKKAEHIFWYLDVTLENKTDKPKYVIISYKQEGTKAGPWTSQKSIKANAITTFRVNQNGGTPYTDVRIKKCIENW